MSENHVLVEIIVDPQVTKEQEVLVTDALAALGFSSRTRVLAPRRGPEQLQWLVLASLPLHAFLSGIGSKIAEDGYRGLQSAIRRTLRRPEVPAPRPLVLQDSASGLQIVLDPDLPEDGYQQLIDLDLSRFRFGPVRYDRGERRWRSDLDEARPGQ